MGKFLATIPLISGIKIKWQKAYFSKNHTYWKALLKELIHLQSISKEPHDQDNLSVDKPWEKFKIVDNLNNIEPKTIEDKSPFKIVVNIEGLHSFLDNKKCFAESHKQIIKRIDLFKKKEYSTVSDISLLIDKSDPYFEEHEKKALESFKPTPIFSIGLCHFEFNHYIGETTGLPLPEFLKPIGPHRVAKSVALNREGKLIINHLLSKKENERRILIDVKHSGPRARAAFYKLLDEFEEEHKEELIDEKGNKIKIPIICSHTGVSGFETLEECYDAPDYYWSWKYAPYDKFNPMPINLCNEDIKIIYESGGLIGLLVEQRVLGDMRKIIGLFGKTKYHKRIIEFLNDNDLITEFEEDFAPSTQIMLVHGIMFLDNLFQCIEVMNRTSDYWKTVKNKSWGDLGRTNPWDHVCIGSDFDGTIDPIECCPSSKHLPDFKDFLKKLMSNPNIRKRYEYMPEIEDLDNCLHKLFYENVRRFTVNQIRLNW